MHLLVRLPATVALAEVVGQVKGASTHLVTHEISPGEFFKWQGGYGAFSVSTRNLQHARDYINHQRDHHCNGAIPPHSSQTIARLSARIRQMHTFFSPRRRASRRAAASPQPHVATRGSADRETASPYVRRWETRRGGSRRDQPPAAPPGESPPEEGGYYGLPAIHAPHWNWLIVAYFFLGGIAGGSYALASIADLLGGAGNRRIARAGRYLALATMIPCPVLLILDLGRPERFHHMLRVVKIRSPLSVGTWILLGFGGIAGLSGAAQAARDGLLGRDTGAARLGRRVPLRAVGAAGIAPAFALAGYTGTLLGATAVPLWARNARLLGPLFLASALASASAALALILAARPGDDGALARLERLDTVAQLAELGLLLATQARLGPVLDRPLRQGSTGLAHRAGTLGLGLALPLGLRLLDRLLGHRAPRATAALGALATLAGGLCFRYAMVYGGRASANDPQATFEFAKEDRGVSA